MKKNFKKCFALLLSVIMVVAMTVTAFAATNNNTSGGETDVPVADEAPTTGTLTIENTKAGVTYTAYPVFTAEVKEGDNTYTWTPVAKFGGILNGKTAKDIAGMDAAAVKALAESLAASTSMPEEAGNVTIAENQTSGSISNLPLGYYLVKETGTNGLNASQPMLVAIPQVQGAAGSEAWVYDITVAPKSSSTDFTKKIAEGDDLVDTNTKDVGDYVDYRLWADVPTYADDCYTNDQTQLTFEITDQMSDQLTWGSESKVSVYVIENSDESTIANIVKNGTQLDNTDSVNYVIQPAASVNNAGETFTVKFTKKFLTENKGKVVVVAFSAQLNENAKIADDTGDTLADYNDNKLKDQNYNGKGNPNAAKLKYTNVFNAKPGSSTDEIKDIVTTFTFKLDVEKQDASDEEIMLEGAEFKVYTDEECTTEYANAVYKDGKLVTEGPTGSATGEGFDAGTYYVKETKAPAGYKLYDGKIKVVINALTDATSGEFTGKFNYTITMMPTAGAEEAVKGTPTVVTVKDEKGLTLPGTGGIGTTIFTFGGLALVILAAAMFIVYMKRQKNQA